MGRKSAYRAGIRDEQPGLYFLELRNHFLIFFGLKYLNSLMRIRDPGWRQFGSRIRDGKKSDPGSGIRDKHSGSATLVDPFQLNICDICKAFLGYLFYRTKQA